MATAPKTQYVESVAEGYAAAYDKLPLAELEYEMVSKAIGDCTGKTVLDLGGGNGQYARKAVELGAELVDVIDISSAMLQLGRKMEEERGHHSKIRWFEGDATKALHNLPLLPDGYDVVMCNWVFDHATNEDELESMWRNTSAQCKPGGRLVNVRGTGPYDAGYAVNGKYGISLSDVTPIPGGTWYQVHCHLDPPIEFEGTSLKTTSSLSNEINHRYGFGDLDILKPENTETVRANEGFWEEFVRTPYLAILTARKL